MIRKAHTNDVAIIHNLTKDFAADGLMLALSFGDITERLRDFLLYLDEDNTPIGCIALHVVWEGLVEIRSLAVKKNVQKKGIGKKLVEAALLDARELGATKTFTLTFVPDFFKKSGFKVVDRSTLPHKVWQDCIKCPLFPDCGETAMTLEL